MNFTVLPCLTDMVLQKIAEDMWTESDARELKRHTDIQLHSIDNVDRSWKKLDYLKELEDKIMRRVAQLPLPELLKSKLRRFVRSVGRQIFAWADFHGDYFGFNINLPKKFYWTARGCVDLKKTARHLALDKDVEIPIRYAIAHMHCVIDEDEIEEAIGRHTGVIGLTLALFWSKRDPEEVAKLIEETQDVNLFGHGVTEDAFRYAALTGNEAATKFFLDELPPKRKEMTLERTTFNVLQRVRHFLNRPTHFCSIYFANILHYLLSSLKNAQRMLYIGHYTHEILICFSEWPWRHLFREILENAIASFDCSDFLFSLLHTDHSPVRNSRDYGPFFIYVWNKMPQAYKKLVIENYDMVHYVSEFFSEGDEESSMIMLKDAITIVGQEFVFQENGRHILWNLIYLDNLGSLFESFIETCLTTKESMLQFEEDLPDHITRAYPDENNPEIITREYRKAAEIMKKHMQKFEDESSCAKIKEVIEF